MNILSTSFFSIEFAVGITAGILTGISMLPQLIRIIRKKRANEVSLIMLLILMSGLGCWVGYGILKKDLPIIITNAFSLCISSLVLFFRIKYRD